jgi:hypothetical protein
VVRTVNPGDPLVLLENASHARDELRVWREGWPYSWFPPAPAKYSQTEHELPPPHPLLRITAKVWPAVVS